MNIKSLKPNGKGRYKQGYYKPSKPEKYEGDINKIIFRSSWERAFCIYCDRRPEILKWSSEPFKIPYLNPVSEKINNYFPDFWIKVQNPDGSIDDFVIEIKPAAFVKKPRKPRKKTTKAFEKWKKRHEDWTKNLSKWSHAKKASEKNGYKFRIITENFFKK